MKRYVLLYIVAVVSILTIFFITANIMKVPLHREVDMPAVNEIVKQAGINWHNLERLDETGSPYSFFIADLSGQIRYTKGYGMPGDVQSAIRLGYLPMDITIDGRAVGKALIETTDNDEAERMLKRFATLTIAAFSAMIGLNSLFLIAIYGVIIKPFRRLEKFAYLISSGNFDEPLPMDKNNIFGLFTQSFDLMRSSLLESRKKQYAAEREKKELIASLSHDVQTPMTAIRILAELLQVSATDPSIADKLRTIEMKANQVSHLMNDLMHSALEELGELRVEPTVEKASLFYKLFEDADYMSKTKLDNIPACLVEIDISRMAQVLGNIISNSYKYAGTDIDVSFRISGEMLEIDISDYGGGVENDTLELIFAKFYRGEKAKASNKEGEGLGLFISMLLINKMGGSIEALNRDERFTIRLLLRLST